MGSELIITSNDDSLTVNGQTFRVRDSDEAIAFIRSLSSRGGDFIKRLADRMTPFLLENAVPQDNIGRIIQAVISINTSLQKRLLAQAPDLETLKRSDLDEGAVEEITLAIILGMAKTPGIYSLGAFDSVQTNLPAGKEKNWFSGKLRSNRRIQ